jgi:homoserine dehydrogenase
MTRKISFGLIGTGNIGSSVIKYVDENFDYILKTKGYKLIPKMVYDINPKNLRFLRKLKTVKPEVAKSPWEVIRHPGIEIVVETTGNVEAGFNYACQAFDKGKGFATAGKDLIAERTRELFERARYAGQGIGFEASTMGGVPIINYLRRNTDKVISHRGILNGTSNLILTEMPERGKDGAIRHAQEIGAAEPDHRKDTEGWDTANKNKILVALLYGADIGYEPVKSENFRYGIQDISELDIMFAGKKLKESVEEPGYKIKLLGRSKLREDGKLEVQTYPFLVKETDRLSGIEGTLNGLRLHLEKKGLQTFEGKGAEPGPTGATLVEDIMNLADQRQAGNIFVPYIGNDIEVVDPMSIKFPFYLRFTAYDRPGVLSKLSGVLGDNNVSIDTAIQKGQRIGDDETVPVFLVTYPAPASSVMHAVNYIDDALKGTFVKEKTTVIRVENDI